MNSRQDTSTHAFMVNRHEFFTCSLSIGLLFILRYIQTEYCIVDDKMVKNTDKVNSVVRKFEKPREPLRYRKARVLNTISLLLSCPVICRRHC